MKTNLKRKLALSGLSLGVAALSLSATTYAWLTSNSVATTNDVAGSTGPDENLFVRGDMDDHFSNKATFSIKGADNELANDFVFTNVSYQNDGFKQMTGVTGSTPTYGDAIATQAAPAENAKYDGQGQASGVMAFHVQFQAPINSTVYLKKANIRSTGETSFVLKADAGSDDTVKKGKSLTAKLEDALSLSVSSVNAEGTKASYKHYRNSAASTTVLYNAVTYYNNIMNLTVPATMKNGVLSNDISHEATVLSTGSVASDLYNNVPLVTMPSSTTGMNQFFTPVADEQDKVQTGWITFYLWLNGWDNECFDAVRNQSVTASFEFTTKPTQTN